MHGWLVLQLLILLVVANGTAVVAKKILGVAFGRPLDGGALFVDGEPIFGPSKTIRGVVASLLGTSICAALMGLGWQVGTLIATLPWPAIFSLVSSNAGCAWLQVAWP